MSKSSKSSLLEVFAYVAIVVSAIAWLLVGLHNHTSLDFGNFVGVLQLVATVLTFIVVAFVAYGFTKGKSMAIKVIYWVIVVLFLVCAVLGCNFF